MTAQTLFLFSVADKDSSPTGPPALLFSTGAKNTASVGVGPCRGLVVQDEQLVSYSMPPSRQLKLLKGALKQTKISKNEMKPED